MQKLRQVQQGDTKVYNCTFQLHLLQLRILLKFPCRFFIEWKTVNGKKSVRTEGLVECINGKVTFNQNLLIETEMLYSTQNNQWIRKISTVSVYLITKNKPDFSQLAGRLNIDLSLAMQANPYKQILTQSLTHASTSADLKFFLDMKSSLQSQKLIRQVDLLQFSDRLMYVDKENDLLGKSKSMGYLKSGHSMVSPVYQLNSALSQISVEKVDQSKPLHFPKTKLQNLGHLVFESIELQQNQQNSENNEFNVRMTLGKQKRNLSREDYELMIDQQTKGMKKSDLMAVPDMKKSGIEEDDSQFNTQRSKKTQQDQFPFAQQNFGMEKGMKKAGSQKKWHAIRPNSPQSDVDILIDMSEGLLQSREINKNESDRKGMMINIINSMNSSNSFSISQFKAQFESSGHQNPGKIKSQKQSTVSLDGHQKESLLKSMQKNDAFDLNAKYQLTLKRMNKLQLEVNQLAEHLADSKQKHQNLQEQLMSNKKMAAKFQQENKQLLNTVKQLHQKSEYESKINLINAEKLKKVSSQLTVERSKIRSSESSNLQSQAEKLKYEIFTLKQKLKAIDLQNQSLKEKLQQRDQIELQNQIRIQELQEHLERQRTLNANKILEKQSFSLGSESKIQKKQSLASQKKLNQQTISSFEENIRALEIKNLELQRLSSQKDRIFAAKIQEIQNEVSVAQREFQCVIAQLLKKQKLLSQKSLQVDQWKTKSYTAAFASSAQQQLKTRHLQQELKKNESIINSYKCKIEELQLEIKQLSSQNLQLTESYNKLMRESYRFEGELRVVKQEESFRESVVSSGGEAFRLSGSHGLTVRQESAYTFFKETLEKYYQKCPKSDKLETQLIPQIYDIRKKAFFELQKASFAIIDLLNNFSSLEQKIQILKDIQVKTENQHQLKLQQLQNKIYQLQQNEPNSAGSSNIVPSGCPIKSSIENFDQFSEVTKKRSLLLTTNVQTKLTREIQKLKSIIYDKNKEISDLIASYQKLKLQKQTQSMLIKSKRLASIQKQHLSNEDDQFFHSDVELVHDILDLQIRLNKQKEKKNLVTQELELRKSLNRSQQLSQNIPHFDLSTVYNEIRAIISGRENYMTTQETLKNLVIKINELNQKHQNQSKDKSYKLAYYVEEKSRILSKQMQVMKSTLLKLNFKGLESMQCKTLVANAFKPAQYVMNDLLLAIQQMINSNEE